MGESSAWPTYGLPRWEKTVQINAPKYGLTEAQMWKLVRQAWQDGYKVGIKATGYNRASPLKPEHQCLKCMEVKPTSEFYLSTKGYVQAYCKPCNSEHARGWNNAHKELTNARRRDRYAGRVKECKSCGIVKAWVDYYEYNGLPRTQCKRCQLKGLKDINKNRRVS